MTLIQSVQNVEKECLKWNGQFEKLNVQFEKLNGQFEKLNENVEKLMTILTPSNVRSLVQDVDSLKGEDIQSRQLKEDTVNNRS